MSIASLPSIGRRGLKVVTMMKSMLSADESPNDFGKNH